MPNAMFLGARLALAGLASAASLSGCAPACPAGLGRMQETDLFFGGSVPDAAWARFAAATLTPAFPGGFTVYPASGQWRDPASLVVTREASRVVQVFGAARPANVESVRAAYRVQFHQMAVGLVIRPACAAF